MTRMAVGFPDSVPDTSGPRLESRAAVVPGSRVAQGKQVIGAATRSCPRGRNGRTR